MHPSSQVIIKGKGLDFGPALLMLPLLDGHSEAIGKDCSSGRARNVMTGSG